MKNKITLLGAGLVGTLLSIILKKKGYEVVIYESRPDLRTAAVQAGKSINLAMSDRGWKALDLAGLRKEISEIAIPMHGRQLHLGDGTEVFQPYGKNQEAIYAVSRGELNKKLIDLAEKNGVTIHFNHKCKEINVKDNICTIENKEGEIIHHKASLLIGADGAYSSLRKSYTNLDRSDYQQQYIHHGYKELFIPAGANHSFLIEKNALHIWPRNKYMMIALPNIDGSFTCTLFFPFEGNPSFESLVERSDVAAFIEAQFPDALALNPEMVEDYMINPVASLVTTKISKWYHSNKSFLIGDAAHAIVPFYGQGMNAGFEDVSVLASLIDKHQDNWDAILPEYQLLRKPNGDAVGTLALNNFIEMQDKVADPIFLERKKIEKDLGIRYPNRFNSVYEMVSFSHTAYATALQAIDYQDDLLGKIMKEGDYFELIQQPKFVEKLNQWIEEYESKFKAS